MDYAVGSIVWVRRRNGSWWPGQILGIDDLSASHLTSPRSGTPVKLLGREDASVDWYNLEKSKRVKAFRCGEFDDCIEKAESAEGMPLKKREKYARREDAILHALELERQFLKKQTKLGIDSDRTDCRLSSTVNNSVVMSPMETLGNDNEKHVNLKSHVSCENEIPGGMFPLEVVRDGNQLSEVNLSELTPRMRGLQNCGLQVAPFKEKLSSPVNPNISQKLSVDDSAQALASGSLCVRSALHTNGAGQIALRAKRAKRVYFPAESNDSLDYKGRLAHVEMSSPQLGGGFAYRGSLVGETESTFIDEIESGSSETDSTDSDSDSSETELDMDVEMAMLTETGQDVEERESTSSDDPDELAVTGDMPHLYPREVITCNETVSKWKLKGKRNNRNLVRRSFGSPNGKGITYGTEADYGEERTTNLSHERIESSLHSYRNDFSDALDDDDQMFGLEDDYSLTPRAVPKRQYENRGADWNDWAGDEHFVPKEYWDIKGSIPIYGDRHHFGGGMRSRLVNIDLKVQASYRKEPVPIISLMSKLDGKAIIGHPIQVEALKDGSSNNLFSAIDEFNHDEISNEGSSVLPQAWRTARRTSNFRVPRPHILSSNGAEVAAEFPSFDQKQNTDYKKLNTGSSNHKASLRKKSGPKSHRSFADKKSPKKGLKKLNLSSNQKIRTLSSLSTERSLSRKPLQDSSSYQTDRFIEPKISGATTVACIPVQLVFSRLLEKINRPPLKTASNAALLNAGVEINS